MLGPPDRVDDFARDYKSWQYEQADGDGHDDNSAPAYIVCLRTGDGKLMSVTRNFVSPQDVDGLSPPAQTTVHHWPSAAEPKFSLRARNMPGGNLLLAM